jgi:hypothetical protein
MSFYSFIYTTNKKITQIRPVYIYHQMDEGELNPIVGVGVYLILGEIPGMGIYYVFGD